ncbi:MAG: PIN domain-containing protein [Lewinellaceae bacterium]|nr:PIN domain-containing protein [Saprospiraceae bacterium]MCB9338479.1 PIN domain-containing protein [Lewinellaceae bacterium]
MKNIFLDTNILLDYLTQRQPFFADAESIFIKAEMGVISLFCSSLSFSTIFYVLRKFQTKPQLFQTLNDLTQTTTITGVDETVIKDSLASGFKDLEDAIQYFSALHFGRIDAIVTRNPKDFPNPQIPVFSPAEFLFALNKI